MHHEPLYRQALRKSWDLTWHHKFLWVFGLFAAFLGQMGILELFGKVGLASSSYSLSPQWLALPSLIKSAIQGGVTINLSFENWVWLICLVIIFIGLGLFLVFTAVVSQGAIIRAAAQFDEKNNLPSISDAWQAGVRHFWRLFFINLFKKIVLVLLAITAGWGTLMALIFFNIWAILLFLLVFVLTIFVGMVLSFMVVYSAGYVVVEEYHLFKAIRHAWKLFLKHWLVSLEVSFIVLFLNVLVVLVAIVGFFVLFLPAVVATFFAMLTADTFLLTAGTAISLILYILYLIFLGSVFTIFTTAVWTDLFMKMHHEGVKSRIMHALTWKKGE